jgi:hypothetical protein
MRNLATEIYDLHIKEKRLLEKIEKLHKTEDIETLSVLRKLMRDQSLKLAREVLDVLESKKTSG